MRTAGQRRGDAAQARRARLAAGIAFLGLDDLWLEAEVEDLVALVVGVAEGRVGKAEVAVFVQHHVAKLADA